MHLYLSNACLNREEYFWSKLVFFFLNKYPIYVVQYDNITVDTFSEFGRLTILFYHGYL